MTARSPWELALGSAVEQLSPRLRAYIAALPGGSVGRGSGVFEVAGAPQRWLRPLLLPLSAVGVLHPAYEADVPFRVENRPGIGPSVSAERTFLFRSGEWTMRDRVAIAGGRLVDDLGPFRVRLHAAVRGGALVLTSTALTVRIAGRRVPVPRLLTPVLWLEERYDEGAQRQHVHLRLTAPVIGLLYEYRGGFDYTVEEDG